MQGIWKFCFNHTITKFHKEPSMQTIWKFHLQSSSNTIDMPKGARVLSIQTQRNYPCIWALCDPDAETEERTFVLYPTGKECPEGINGTYVGTYQQFDGDFVFHCFEKE